MAGDEVILKLWITQVKVSVFELQLVPYLIGVCYLKRRSFGSSEDTQLLDIDLDKTCGELWVYALTRSDNALCEQHVLGSDCSCLFKDILIGIVVERKLQQTCAVAQIDEQKVSDISYSVRKAADNDLAALCLRYFCAVMRSAQAFHGVKHFDYFLYCIVVYYSSFSLFSSYLGKPSRKAYRYDILLSQNKKNTPARKSAAQAIAP